MKPMHVRMALGAQYNYVAIATAIKTSQHAQPIINFMVRS